MAETVKTPGNVLPAGIGTPPGVAVGSTSVGAGELAKGAVTLGVRRVREGGDFDAGDGTDDIARQFAGPDALPDEPLADVFRDPGEESSVDAALRAMRQAGN
jgi:hypothetical protein